MRAKIDGASATQVILKIVEDDVYYMRAWRFLYQKEAAIENCTEGDESIGEEVVKIDLLKKWKVNVVKCRNSKYSSQMYDRTNVQHEAVRQGQRNPWAQRGFIQQRQIGKQQRFFTP